MSSHFTVYLVNVNDFQQESLLAFGWDSSLSTISPVLLNAQHARFLMLNARSSSLPSSAPPLPHQLSHVRTRHALPSFPNAFLSRMPLVKSNCMYSLRLSLGLISLGNHAWYLSYWVIWAFLSPWIRRIPHILYSHCFPFSHWAGSFSRKNSSLHPQYLGYNRHSISIVRRVYAPQFCLVTTKIWSDGH